MCVPGLTSRLGLSSWPARYPHRREIKQVKIMKRMSCACYFVLINSLSRPTLNKITLLYNYQVSRTVSGAPAAGHGHVARCRWAGTSKQLTARRYQSNIYYRIRVCPSTRATADARWYGLRHKPTCELRVGSCGHCAKDLQLAALRPAREWGSGPTPRMKYSQGKILVLLWSADVHLPRFGGFQRAFRHEREARAHDCVRRRLAGHVM